MNKFSHYINLSEEHHAKAKEFLIGSIGWLNHQEQSVKFAKLAHKEMVIAKFSNNE